MWQRTGNRDAPVNNLMVRSQLAGSFQGPGIADTPLRAGGMAAFSWLFHDREDFYYLIGEKPFVIMKFLLKGHARKTHPPPQAHFPRVPGAFIADRITVGRYPCYSVGNGPR